MAKGNYTEEELDRYFNDPKARRAAGSSHRRSVRPTEGYRGFFYRKFDNPEKAEAACVLYLFLGVGLAGMLIHGVWALLIMDDLPSFRQIDNPDLQLATIAYTANNKALARYAFQNRSWVSYEEISPHVINALV